MKRIITLVIMTLSLAICTTIFGQLVEVPLNKKTDESSLIVEGKVISQRAFTGSNGRIYTTNTVELYKVLKDSHNKVNEDIEKIEIITEGGKLNDRMLVVSHALNLSQGEIGMFFLKPSNQKMEQNDLAYKAVAAVQAFARYDVSNKTANDLFHQYNNLLTDLYEPVSNYTNQPIRHVKDIDSFSIRPSKSAQTLAAPTISSFTPTIASAGTETILTITGSSFGASAGTVWFKNANDGGATFISALASDIISWSDTEIQVYVPTSAGTGVIEVETSGSTTGTSAGELTITFNYSNVESSGVHYPPHLIDADGSGGYTYKYSSATANNGVSFSGHTNAITRFEDALQDWNCNTGFNATVNGSTATGITDSDGEFVVMFDNDVETLPSGVLGTAYSYYSGCSGNWYVSDIDIVFRRDGTDGTTWYFGENAAGQGGGETDFQSVALHELGHTHQLGHVINSGYVMHYSLTTGTNSRDLNATSDIAGGNYIMTQSTGFASCTKTGMTSFNCSLPPVAQFTSDKSGICGNAPQTVQFTDQSTNGATSWLWDFGDGNTSTNQNPSHVYNSNGVFTVSLVAANGNGSDTVIRESYITIYPTPGSACPVPTDSLDNYGTGINRVVLNGIDKSTGSTYYDVQNSLTVDGYIDYSCTHSTILWADSTYSIDITVGNSYPEYVRVYIDYDNDNSFNNIDELVFSSSTAMGTHSGNLVVPSTATKETRLLLRVMSDYFEPTGSCDAPTYGQVEDYSVIIPSLLESDFTVDMDTTCAGDTVIFTDVSSGDVTTWDWDFGAGASPATATGQGPHAVVYSSAGNKTVSLTIGDGTDSDMNTRTDFVTIHDRPVIGKNITNINCYGDSDGAIDITVSGGGSPYSYNWNTSATTEDISALPADTYTLQVLDTNGCEAIDTAFVVEPTAIVDSVFAANITCNGNTDGAIDLTVSGGTGGYTYDWDNDGTGDFDDTQDLTNLAATTYHVVIKDANGCLLKDTVGIIEPAVLSNSVDSIDHVLCNDDKSGKIHLTVTGGTAPYTYDWDYDGMGDNDDKEDPDSLMAGRYRVTITDSTGCSVIDSADVTEPTILTMVIDSVQNLNCFGDNDGGIFTSVSGGTGSYTYDWDNDGTGDNDDVDDITSLAAGWYRLTVTDDNGCFITDSSSVTSPDALSDSIFAANITCQGNTDGLIDIAVSGGTGGYTYDWDNDGTGDFDDTQDLTNLAATTYHVVIKDANGCLLKDTVDIKEPAVLGNSVDSVDHVLCNGDKSGKIHLTVTGGTAPYTYDWDYDGMGDNDDKEDPDSLMAGRYRVTITDSTGCSVIDSADVTEPTKLTMVIDSVQNLNCFGDNDGGIFTSVSGGTGSYTYDWDNDGTGDNDDIDDITSLAAGWYRLTVTDDNGCFIADSAAVTSPTELSDSLFAMGISCNGSADGSIDLTVSGGAGGYTYDWDNDGTGDFDDTEDLQSLRDTTYRVTIRDANGCGLIDSLTIMDPAPLSTVIDSVQDVLCYGEANGKLYLSVSGGVEPYTYDWDNDGSGDNDDMEDLISLSAGVYHVTIIDSNGCVRIDSANVMQPDSIYTKIDSISHPLCYGDSTGMVFLSVSGGSGNYIYDWDADGTGDNDDAEDISLLTAGVYRVTVTDSKGCSKQDSASLIEPSLLNIIIDSLQHVSCNGNKNGEISITVSGGVGSYSYDWDNDGKGDNDDSQDLQSLMAGAYEITVTDSNGCKAIDTITITAPDSLILAIDTVRMVTCYGLADGEVEITVTGGNGQYQYDWSNDGTGDTDDVQDLTGIGAGTYDVEVTDTNGCNATANVTVTQPDSLRLSASVIEEVAGSDGAIDLKVSGGTKPYTYDWNNDGTGDNDDTEDLTGLLSGVYKVTVTDSNLCSDTLSVLVDIKIDIVELVTDDDIQIYPNPSSGIFTYLVDIRSQRIPLTLEIVNTLGQMVYSAQIFDDTPLVIDMKSSLEGVYLIRLTDNKRIVNVKRLVLIR